jgi:threonine/homoserine/homoserine lactone efflux protein
MWMRGFWYCRLAVQAIGGWPRRGARGGTDGHMIAGVIPLWAFLAVTVPLVLTPGASTAIVLRNSLTGGTRAGLETAVGANAGSLCYGLLCAFGFALALQQWPGVWVVLRGVGVAYLTWLGLQSLARALGVRAVDRSTAEPGPSSGVNTGLQNVKEGFITNAANPAIATFYFLILPQFIPADAPIVSTALLLTGVHIALAATWHAVWAAAGGALARTLASGRPRRILDLAAGVALLGLAASLLVR